MNSLSASLLTRKHINDKSVRCSTCIDFSYYTDNRCEWIGKLHELDAHLKVCEHNKCPHCHQHIIVGINHLNICEVDCDKGCGQRVAYKNRESHCADCENILRNRLQASEEARKVSNIY